MTREVILYTRKRCGLCDDAATELRRLAPELGFTLAERDIDEDPGLRARYDELVPVVVAGGHVVAEAPIDATRLRERLAAALR